MDNMRARLVARLKELDAAEAASTGSRAVVELDQQAVGRLSRMDALQHQAMAEAQSRHRARDKARVGAALKRLDEGDYGYCLDCGEDMEAERLAIDPALSLCGPCTRERRP